MLGIAILGLGTVGQGLVQIINDREKEIEKLLGKKIEIRRVLVKDKGKERDIKLPEGILTDDFNEIIRDEKIQVVIEVTSGLDQVYPYVKSSIEQGKHIITANKAIVSKYFEELSQLAEEKQVAFLYEASVAGGIPVIKALKEHIALNEINEIQGILNGTCNYILSRMTKEGLDYEKVLKKAQELGYAEADPKADVEGHDTLRKLRIISTLALQGKVDEEDILLEGIERIKAVDIRLVERLDAVIKLIGEGACYEDGFTALVMPAIVRNDSYFSNVAGAFNSVAFNGSNVGELKFYGPGAGKLPTANAVLTDLLDIGLNNFTVRNPLGDRKLKNNNDIIKGKYYLRISQENKKLKDKLKTISEKILNEEKDFAIISREVKLREVYNILKEFQLEKQDYFIARFL